MKFLLIVALTILASCGQDYGYSSNHSSSRNAVQCQNREYYVNQCIAHMTYQYGQQYAVHYCSQTVPMNGCY
jgi:hypothetical protein